MKAKAASQPRPASMKHNLINNPIQNPVHHPQYIFQYMVSRTQRFSSSSIQKHCLSPPPIGGGGLLITYPHSKNNIVPLPFLMET